MLKLPVAEHRSGHEHEQRAQLLPIARLSDTSELHFSSHLKDYTNILYY